MCSETGQANTTTESPVTFHVAKDMHAKMMSQKVPSIVEILYVVYGILNMTSYVPHRLQLPPPSRVPPTGSHPSPSGRRRGRRRRRAFAEIKVAAAVKGSSRRWRWRWRREHGDDWHWNNCHLQLSNLFIADSLTIAEFTVLLLLVYFKLTVWYVVLRI